MEISKDINSDDEDDVYDPSIRTKRSGPKISVKKSYTFAMMRTNIN